jgi:diguanylate cyclase (GGDEF)-like protein
MSDIDFLPQIEQDIRRFETGHVTAMRFAPALETRYRRETARARASILLTQGLVALLAYDFFIVGDYILAPQYIVRAAVIRFGIVTPLVLLVSLLFRRSENTVVVESAASLLCMVGSISIISLHQGGSGRFSASAQTGLVLVLLVSNCMLRLEQSYAIATSLFVLLLDAFALGRDVELASPQKMFHGGILMWVAILTLTANFTLTRERRYSYLLQLRGRVQHRMLAKANSELTALSATDRLTGLPNRRSYDERILELWEVSVERNEPLSAVMIDVDHFKRLNDAHGHPYGDRVLQRVASLLQQALRGEEDFVARFGGEEFVVLLPNADPDTAIKVAERICLLVRVAGSPALQREVTPVPLDVWSTVSCGVATAWPGASHDPLNLISEADAALYRAKQGGRNRVCCAPSTPATITA